MKEKLQEYALIAEIIGALAIVLSLIFVGYEIRQNSLIQTRVMTQALVTGYSNTVSLIVESEELRCAYAKGMRDFNGLSGTEAATYSGYALAVWRQREDLYFHHLDGLVDPRIWKGFEGTNKDVAQYPGFQQWFEFRKHWFSDEFREYIEGLMESPSIPVPFQDSKCDSNLI
jgi:hypothetical protein